MTVTTSLADRLLAALDTLDAARSGAALLSPWDKVRVPMSSVRRARWAALHEAHGLILGVLGLTAAEWRELQRQSSSGNSKVSGRVLTVPTGSSTLPAATESKRHKHKQSEVQS